MGIQPASGSKDLNPLQVEQNNLIAAQLADVYKNWGYIDVKPPKIERLETLVAGGAISRKDIAELVADEELGLRPEMTASIARAASTRYADKTRPLRLGAIGTVFKTKEDSDGKQTIEEYLESDVEIFGAEDMKLEVELLAMLLDSLNRLNISNQYSPRLLIGHTSLIDILLSTLPSDIDKSKLIELFRDYDLIGLNKHCSNSLNEISLKQILNLRGEPETVISHLKNEYGNNKVLDELKTLFSIIEPISADSGVEIQLDPTFKPDYELYTGIVFKLVCQGSSSLVEIARGGRYDGMINLFGKLDYKQSGAGFSFSIDKVRELITKAITNNKEQKKFLVAYGPSMSVKDALNRQKRLHKKGMVAILEHMQCQDESEAISLLDSRGCNRLDWVN